jgi:hypothetical protein
VADDTISDWETSSNVGPEAEPAAPAAPAETLPAASAATAEPPPASASAAPADRDEHGRFRPRERHRARSAQANPDDVPRIRELTRKLREAETERDALKARPAPAAAPAAPAAPPPQAQPSAQLPPGRPSVPLTRPEPAEEEIGTKYKTYAEFTKDQARWVHEQERAADRAEAAQLERQKTRAERVTAFEAKKVEARARIPNYDAVLSSADHILATPQMQDAILTSDRSADLAHWLATHQPEYQALNARSQAIQTFSQMELLRDVLESKLPPAADPQRRSPSGPAADTGSAASRSFVPAPRPPNPVRTGPLKTGDELPGDESSLEDHIKAFHKGLRHGRRV